MPEQPEMIELAARDQTLGVLPLCGGGLGFWRRGAHDLLRPAAVRDEPLALGCFPLVPYSNRIRHGRFRFDGDEIRLPLNFGDHPHSIHGHGWQAPWQVTSRRPAGVELTYRHRADAWPFDYEARQGIALSDRGLTLDLSVTNRAERRMPAGLGFHPYFAGAGAARLTAEVDGVWHTDHEVMPTEWTALPARWNLPAGIAVAGLAADNLFTNWRGAALIERPDLGLRLTLRAGAPFRHLVVYAPLGESFFCVEPVSHVTDALNAPSAADSGLEVLAPGESLEARLRIDVETG